MRQPSRIGYLVEEDGEVRFMDDPHGSFRIYKEKKERCVIGADVSEGINEDENAAVVLGVDSNATLAVFNSNKIDPDEFAIFLSMLGKYFKYPFNPLIGVERNSVGFSVVSDLLKIYPTNCVYFNYRLDEKTKIKTKKFGWITDEKTRYLMLGYLQKEIREASTELNDKQLILQCMKFINKDGKPQAAEGEKDDLVMARAIAGMMRRYQPAEPTREFVPESVKVY